MRDTQERTASLLGVQREGVTGGALKLQKAKLIDHHRGHMSIIDSSGLEARSCECCSGDRPLRWCTPTHANRLNLAGDTRLLQRATPATPLRGTWAPATLPQQIPPLFPCPRLESHHVTDEERDSSGMCAAATALDDTVPNRNRGPGPYLIGADTLLGNDVVNPRGR